MPRIRRVLHATDFSPASAPALRWATALARASRAQLTVLHVMTPPVLAMPGEGYVSPALYENLEATARRQARKRLAAIVARARKAGVRVTPLLLEGLAADGISRAARSRKADLVVIGTHGRTGLAKLFLGSVAARVVAQCARPVLTVRGR